MSSRCGCAWRRPYSVSSRRIAAPYCRISSENIERPAISSARFCMAASRSTGSSACATRLATASCAQVDDVPSQHRQVARRQRRRDGATLVAPVLALAEQQALAGDRAQDADRGRRAAVVRMIVDQHAMDRVRRIEQHLAAAQEAADQDILLVCRLGPHGQRIGADGAQEAEERQFLRRDRRARRVARRFRLSRAALRAKKPETDFAHGPKRRTGDNDFLGRACSPASGPDRGQP